MNTYQNVQYTPQVWELRVLARHSYECLLGTRLLCFASEYAAEQFCKDVRKDLAYLNGLREVLGDAAMDQIYDEVCAERRKQAGEEAYGVASSPRRARVSGSSCRAWTWCFTGFTENRYATSASRSSSVMPS